MHFYYVYQGDMKDHAVMVLSYLIALFHCGENKDNFRDSTQISDIQENTLFLLSLFDLLYDQISVEFNLLQ